MSRFRTLVVIAYFALILASCGGGGEESTDQGSDATTGETSAGSPDETTTPTDGGSDDTTGGTQGEVVIGSGDGTAEYTLSGGVESSGELTLVPSMTFYSDGIWTLSFGSEDGALLLINLDPSTPSVNVTDGATTASGDTSGCDFEVTRQDADGASGSFDCSNVAVVDGGVLKQAESFVGSFDANP